MSREYSNRQAFEPIFEKDRNKDNRKYKEEKIITKIRDKDLVIEENTIYEIDSSFCEYMQNKERQ